MNYITKTDNVLKCSHNRVKEIYWWRGGNISNPVDYVCLKFKDNDIIRFPNDENDGGIAWAERYLQVVPNG